MTGALPTVGLLVPPDVLAQPHELRRRYLERVADAGVDHLAVGDHVSFHVGLGFDGLIQATALLAAQPLLPVTVAVYLVALRHPVTVARGLASIGELAPGRLTLGVGVGGEDRHEIELCGIDPRTRGSRTDEALHILRALATGDRIDHHGAHYDITGAQILPAPRPPTPLVVGGRSNAALERTARYGDGWLAIWVSPHRLASAIHQIADIAARVGRSDAPTHHQMNVWCGFGADAAAARAAVAPTMEALYATPFDRFDRYVPQGTPIQVAERLAELTEAGATAFNLIVPDDEPLRAAEHTGLVAQHLRELLSNAATVQHRDRADASRR
jgi:alkanesulfonate monooxygenase SsuD/methylene tetrahydromethanopterin reductase-like flavin-dependent oxidoreductase (luciferase family)